ncbi:hypothetical protein DL766_001704 [Monosporascus sp. MC13-8B]|nr:hypothetical protein DL763_004921 [Monosporascus cannonballus]RYP37030.1 hypothetical protein DL766_001704 [Monosporascus sp. MC13-8B]
MSAPAGIKNPQDYSTNPNTVRARLRKARLDPFTRVKEQALAQDSKAVNRAIKIRSDTESFLVADPNTRRAILEDVEKEVLERRRARGCDAASKIKKFQGGVAANAEGASSGGSVEGDDDTDDATPAGIVTDTHLRTPSSLFGSVFHPSGDIPGTPASMAAKDSSMVVMGSSSFTPMVIPQMQSHSFSHEGKASMVQISFHDHHGDYNDASQSSAITQQFQKDTAPDAVSIANIQSQMTAVLNEFAGLKRDVKALSNDLVAAKSNIAVQEARLHRIECLNCGGSFVSKDMSMDKLNRMTRRIQALADAFTDLADEATDMVDEATEVAHVMNPGDNTTKMSPSKADANGGMDIDVNAQL